MSASADRWRVPVIDVAALVARKSGQATVAIEIGRACRDTGFFYVVGHGVDPTLCEALAEHSRRFFALPDAHKSRIRMELAGRAWRGWFPLGGELTSGVPDDKEGLYFGAELAVDHPLVVARTPLHGANLFPELPGFRETVLAYIDALTRLGHALVRGIALSLGLDEDFFERQYTRDPLVLFRIFRYPALRPNTETLSRWGVGEHTDYGLLTMLLQDDVGGLEVKSRSEWTAAPPIPGSFVCNIGDMLDRMTHGLYRSTPHRARNTSARDRLSFAFFFDPSFDARVRPIEGIASDMLTDDAHERWDHASVHAFDGTYGDYLLAKVRRVFPELRKDTR
ncbi:MAG: isopenicillin N synthase family dioxygenase [Planctomycetota bacterium]